VRRAPSVTLERATSLPREAIIAGFPAVEHLVQLKIIQCAFRLRRCYGLEGLVHTTRLTRGSAFGRILEIKYENECKIGAQGY
jgi:hypothetical protein